MTRTRAIIGGVALAVLLATFLAGRASKHPQVVTRDVVKTQTVEVEKVRTVTVHDVVQAKAVEAKVRRVVVWKWMPGGKVEAVEHFESSEQDHETKQAHAGATQDRAVDVRTTTVELHTSTPVRPRWSFALMPGAQLFGAKALPLYGPLVLGASVERRIAGPVSIGLWGSTSGAAGITLRGDIP